MTRFGLAGLGDLFAAALDEVRYAQPTGDANRSRWPGAPIWRTVRGVLREALFDLTCIATPDLVKRVDRRAHSRMMRENLFGSLATLAVLDGVPAKSFPAFLRLIALEFAERARSNPECCDHKMERAKERYAFT